MNINNISAFKATNNLTFKERYNSPYDEEKYGYSRVCYEKQNSAKESKTADISQEDFDRAMELIAEANKILMNAKN